MVEAGAEGLDDSGASLEVHVGNPEGQEVVAAEFLVHLLEFCGAGVVAVHDAVEVINFVIHRRDKGTEFSEKNKLSRNILLQESTIYG